PKLEKYFGHFGRGQWPNGHSQTLAKWPNANPVLRSCKSFSEMTSPVTLTNAAVKELILNVSRLINETILP
ncbi:5872_t:CDS:2, partial [Funneliformis geosporum]